MTGKHSMISIHDIIEKKKPIDYFRSNYDLYYVNEIIKDILIAYYNKKVETKLAVAGNEKESIHSLLRNMNWLFEIPLTQPGNYRSINIIFYTH
jgi:hypothetical protein